jgi:hypothetical protein
MQFFKKYIYMVLHNYVKQCKNVIIFGGGEIS